MIYLLSPVAKAGICHLPMIQFKLLNVEIELEGYDILLFTSKQAVKSAEKLNPNWKKIPCLAVGSATAKMIKDFGGEIIAEPQAFYAKELSKGIVQKFYNKIILYLRPKVISFDAKAFLSQKGIEIHEKIIYETSCIKYSDKDIPSENAIIIFTSPSTINCFLENFSWNDSYTAVVIGESSKKHLPNNVKCVIADKPSIEACITKAKSLV